MAQEDLRSAPSKRYMTITYIGYFDKKCKYLKVLIGCYHVIKNQKVDTEIRIMAIFVILQKHCN